MKKINNFKNIIAESVKKVLKEYLQQIPDEYNNEPFNWNVFNSLKTNVEKQEYCRQHLGEPIGSGVGRTVYEIDDHTVLKFDDTFYHLPNKQEYEITTMFKDNPLIPKIYGVADDYSWLWVERVIPSNDKNIDDLFMHTLGIKYFNEQYSDKTYNSQYPSVQGFLSWYQIKEEKIPDFELDDWNLVPFSEKTRKFYEKLLSTNSWFKKLGELFEYQRPSEFHSENFGLALRNGKPTMVVIDLGGF